MRLKSKARAADLYRLNLCKKREVCHHKSMVTLCVRFKIRLVFICMLVLLVQVSATLSRESQLNNKQVKLSQSSKLQKLNIKIHLLEKSLAILYEDKSFELSGLRKVERNIASIDHKLWINKGQLKLLIHKVASLERQKLVLNQQILSSQEVVRIEVRNDFVFGRDSTVRLMLSARELSKLKRGLVYREYINQIRLRKIEALNKKIRSIDKINQTLEHKQIQISSIRRQQVEIKNYFEKERRNREKLLANLVKSERQHFKSLKHLKLDKMSLSRVYSHITQAVQAIRPLSPTLSFSFSGLRGKLQWPAIGTIVSRFGKKSAKSQMHKRGVLISAVEGKQVKVIASGRVVFADWLGTFGMIMIIDHGNNYLSLYGHNRSLHKKVGEQVRRGEVIASIGSSGGIKQPALYFEIRKKGVAQNPNRWCKYWPK